jgi:hypothetical protein
MNIGLILFVSSILLGNTGDKSTNTANENQPHDAIASKSTKSNNSSFDDQLSEDSVQIPADFTATEALSNFSLSINRNAETKNKQNEYYAFTPYVEDLNNNKLEFSISNKPEWAMFDSRTGSLFGQPTNWDTGITKDIVISVMTSKGDIASLMAFNLEVININDKPIISGNPSEYYLPLETYSFKPTVKDIDLDIKKDKLRFSIKNNPKWATFNTNTGELSGRPKFSDDDNQEIIISVSDSHGLRATLKPFRIDVAETQSSNLDKPTKVSIKENNSSYLDISYSFFDKSKVIKAKNTSETVETEPIVIVTQPPKTPDKQGNNNTDNVNKTDDIFAWINVRTKYSELDVNGKVRPIYLRETTR